MLADLPKSEPTKRGLRYRHIVDNITATLIINGRGTYRDVMEMDLESALLTYATIYINSLNEAQAIKESSKR